MDSEERLRGRLRGWPHMGRAGAGALRVALLFGSAAIALALILAPVLERRSNEMAGYGVDPVATGSVSGRNSTYTVRRSVFQVSPEAVCIIHADGSRRGAC